LVEAKDVDQLKERFADLLDARKVFESMVYNQVSVKNIELTK
jgi:hypothetical protein